MRLCEGVGWFSRCVKGAMVGGLRYEFASTAAEKEGEGAGGLAGVCWLTYALHSATRARRDGSRLSLKAWRARTQRYRSTVSSGVKAW